MKKKGFTLIELLVVMGIIAVLVGLSAFNFNQARVRARDVQRKNDLSQLQKALEMYKNDKKQKYPWEGVTGDIGVLDLVGGNSTGLLKVLGKDSDYIKIYFKDTSSKTGIWQNYYYLPISNGLGYEIYACLENKGDDQQVTVTNLAVWNCSGVAYKVTNP